VATEIGLTTPQFIAGERVMADELLVLPVVLENVDEVSVAIETASVAAPDLPRPSPAHVAPQRSSSEEPAERPEQAAEHQKLINEVLGHGEPTRRRRWRRAAV
jgi:hypothetical protein